MSARKPTSSASGASGLSSAAAASQASGAAHRPRGSVCGQSWVDGNAEHQWASSIGLAWGAGKGILMLWAYFDDSWLFDKTDGKPVEMCLAGGIARMDQWDRLVPAWRDALATAGPSRVPYFHHKELEGRKGDDNPFKGWSRDQRRAMVIRLLEVVRDIPMNYLDCVVSVSPKTADIRAYRRATKTLIDVAATASNINVQEEQISLVFSEGQTGQSPSPIAVQKYFDQVRNSMPHRLGDCRSENWQRCFPLQVADLLAYILLRAQPARGRWGLPIALEPSKLFQQDENARHLEILRSKGNDRFTWRQQA